MATATFETPEGEEIEVDGDDVIHLKAGDEEGTTIIELEDGDEVVVVASELEIAAELQINPLDYVDPEDDDESLEAIVDDEEGYE